MLECCVIQDGRLPLDLLGPNASVILNKLGTAHVTVQLLPHLQLLEACRNPGAVGVPALKYIMSGPSYYDARFKLQSARLPISSSWILFLSADHALSPEASPDASACIPIDEVPQQTGFVGCQA